MLTWQALREAALLVGPAAAGLFVLLLAGGPSPAGIAFSLLAVLLVAVALTLWREHERARIAGWLARRVGEAADRAGPPPAGRIEDLPESALDSLRRLDQLELQLTHQRSQLPVILAAVPDPVLLLDRNLDVRLSNPAADQTFGVALEGLPLGRAVRDPGILAGVNAALTTGTPSAITFSPVVDRLKRFAARVVPISLDRGAPGVILVLREETEQVLIERMRSDFVANASHEIRTPLASIVGIVETLRGPARNDPAAWPMFLDTLAAEAGRMQRLVDDLLSLSRIELAAHRPPEKTIDPARIAREVVQRVAPAAEQARTEVEAVIEPDLPRVRADADQLHQLLFNLLDNAIKYSAVNRPVRLEVRHLDAAPASAGALSGRRCILLTVRDQGEGIAPEHLARITERFYRVDKARSRKVGGTGLGLAIVKHIIRRHQGHLEIESRPGEGSLFSVYLPLPASSDVHAL